MFENLSLTPPDNNQIFFESYQVLPEKDKKFMESADIHSLFDLQPLSLIFN